MTTRHFIDHIGLCHSYKICYIVIWHVISKFLYIYTYGNTVIMDMDSATGSIDLGDCNTGRFTLSPNRYKPLMSAGLMRKKMNEDSLRMCITIITQGTQSNCLVLSSP